MNIEPRKYGKTCVTVSYPWGMYHRRGSRLLCSDGKVRAPSRLASTPDTFFSTPAAMRIGKKYVTGYMTCDEAVSEDCKTSWRAWTFRQHVGNEDVLPAWPDDKFGKAMRDLICPNGEQQP